MYDFNIRTREVPITLSTAKIKLFSECKAKFFFKYLTDISIKQTKWPGTLFGKACHSIMEDMVLQLNEKIERKEILKNTNGQFERKFYGLKEEFKKELKFPRSYDEDDLISKGNKYSYSLVEFLLQVIPLDYFSLLTEKEFTVNWEYDKDILINGIIDLLLFKDKENYYINDLKVTKDNGKYFFVNWQYNIQSLLYEYITNQEYKVPPKAFNFIVLNYEDKTLFMKRKFIEEINLKYLNNLFQKIKEYILHPFITIECKNYNSKCRWCEFKKVCDMIQ